MKKSYHCMHCQGILNPNIKVILGAEVHGQRGLILLNAQLGDYEVLHPENLALRDGFKINFFCPVCHANLRSPYDQNLVELGFYDGKQEGRVEFSRIYGEHATYVVTEEEICSHGDSASLYGGVNFFGVGGD